MLQISTTTMGAVAAQNAAIAANSESKEDRAFDILCSDEAKEVLLREEIQVEEIEYICKPPEPFDWALFGMIVGGIVLLGVIVIGLMIWWDNKR